MFSKAGNSFLKFHLFTIYACMHTCGAGTVHTRWSDNCFQGLVLSFNHVFSGMGPSSSFMAASRLTCNNLPSSSLGISGLFLFRSLKSVGTNQVLVRVAFQTMTYLILGTFLC